jgi:hypothetical protein
VSEESVSVVEDFDAAWNAHDEDAVLDFFADNAVVKLEPPAPGEPEAYTGKEQIRAFVQTYMPGFHVESRDHQVAGYQEGVGERVIWESTVSSDSFRSLGVDPVEGMTEAIFESGKVKSFTFTLSQETLAKMQEAGGPIT